MGEIKKYHSLTFKLMAAVCLAAVCAVVTMALACLLGGVLVDKLYLSEEATAARMDKTIDQFRDFVTEHQVTSTNVSAIGQWNKDRLTIQLTVFGMSTTIRSSASGAELVGNEYGVVIRDGDLAEESAEYPVHFADGVYAVMVYDSSVWIYVGITVLVALVAAVIVFLSVFLIYDQHITRTVQTLSRQVRQVSRGDLEMQILPMSKDEIGQLALDVDTMRLSIIDKLRREEEAWQANAQLITAISHDVRTPLTALMGYLEILSDETLDPQAREAYLEVCKNNAQRLKGLTDELFGFFLVFGKPVPDQNPEEFDAAMLLGQILMEQELNLHQQGFAVEQKPPEEISGILRVDLSHLRRVFDNLFSNVAKYADPGYPVVLSLSVAGEDLTVSITNHVARRDNRPESNGIGLKTCQKLIQAMGGEFSTFRQKDTFTAEVCLPLQKE